MIVERATDDDLAEVIAIDAASRDQPRTEMLVEAVKQHECYIVRESWEVIGFALLNQHFFKQYFIELLLIHPDHQRKGAATALIRHIVKIIPADKLFTSTNQSNVQAQALFEKLGFVKSGWIDNLDESDREFIYFRCMNRSS